MSYVTLRRNSYSTPTTWRLVPAPAIGHRQRLFHSIKGTHGEDLGRVWWGLRKNDELCDANSVDLGENSYQFWWKMDRKIRSRQAQPPPRRLGSLLANVAHRSGQIEAGYPDVGWIFLCQRAPHLPVSKIDELRYPVGRDKVIGLL